MRQRRFESDYLLLPLAPFLCLATASSIHSFVRRIKLGSAFQATPFLQSRQYSDLTGSARPLHDPSADLVWVI
ncbi:uncharacterized protein K460DRAFT_61268 [Cucurbitaria berberidis CBS 394.84]|uniref:Uncharacterized protein n=1 Tax=Cucurbitaria berberidis CBS 394.84 TaxID=1168544 RepID=A0A9P4GLL5_9PLEO|nr:uncharacterized protein K460DRAFT_61268 [Cucurbitaria berberidis CBS 394.84]KAF1847591.1 hypothetical protein K460DRAFT_61268 [Cucurbitaria berberidis CBS 394.84]